MNIAVIIPALNPDDRLVELVRNLKARDFQNIIIIDDGSDAAHRSIFDTVVQDYRCTLIHHPENLGKGMALKHGMGRSLKCEPVIIGCVTVDADGQHRVEDIVNVAMALEKEHNALILGTRFLDQNDIPAKSKFGNQLTANVFTKVTNRVITDTQTGLRGIPVSMIPMMVQIQGSRYDYEMNMLLEAVKFDIPFVEVPIETVYFDDNKGSHFKAVSDSFRIYRGIIAFACSGGCSAMADLFVFFLLSHTLFIQQIFLANLFARLFSGAVNYTLNKKLVFKHSEAGVHSALRYGLLFAVQTLLSSSLVWLLSGYTNAPFITKIGVDAILFFISYQIQKLLVFTSFELETNRKQVG